LGNFNYFCMEITYRKNKLEKQCSNASEIKKAFGSNAKRVASRLDDILASPNLTILIQIAAANCHPLYGDKRGKWAIDISGNFRLIFEIADDPVPKTIGGIIDTSLITKICILEIIDYH
jgi:plasmid maintenance system killer protein